MNKKLKIAFKYRSSEQGFAIPIAVGIGLIMILIATMMIVRSQGEQLTASAQKATARSLGAAETGTTRVQSLLNKYRILANITLTNIATTPPSSSWKQAYSGSSVCGAGGGVTEVNGYRLNQWISLGSGEQFRVTNYTYISNSSPSGSVQVTGAIPASGSVPLIVLPNTYLADGSSADGVIEGIQGSLSRSGAVYTFERLFSGTATTPSTRNFFPTTTPGFGILEVEGQRGTGIKATSHLQVKIPVQSGDISIIKVPGAFIGTGGTGNNQIQGNVLLRDCGVDVGDVNITGTDPNTGQPYTASHTNLALPKLPTRPNPFITTPSNHILGVINSTTLPILPGAVNTSGSHYMLTLPRTGDTPTSGVYEYSLTSMDLPNGSSLVISPGKKVKLYLEGNIEKGGDITHNCSTFTSEDLNSNGLLDSGEDTNSNGVLDVCKPTNFQIFGYGPLGSRICMNGNGYIEAFILAPKYTAGAAGTGGTGGIKGSVWINSWSDAPGCGSNTSNIVITQAASWTDIGLTPRNLSPKIAPISSWQRQEALP